MMMMMKKSSLSVSFLLFLLFPPTASGLGSVLSKSYFYNKDNHLSWADAQTHCRKGYNSDLAVIYTQADSDSLDLSLFYAWIGLHRWSISSYRWSIWKWSNLAVTSFSAWAGSEPGLFDDCAVMTSKSDTKVFGFKCSKHYFFICHEPHNDHYHYHFEVKSMTWSDARQYCRSQYTDLSTFRFTEDLKDVTFPEEVPVWTGLHKQGGTWQWSKGLSDFRDWRSGEPSSSAGKCVTMGSKSKKMATADCATRYPFVCHRDNLILVKEEKTWEEALEHCRALGTHGRSHDLFSLQPGAEHTYAMNIVREADTDEVWTGLRFLAGVWWWVNGAELLYSGLPLCPPEQRHCGILAKNDRGNVEIRNCSERRNFLCYIK